MLEAIVKELELQQDYIREDIHTVYLGGGTPSLLTLDQIQLILDNINQHYNLSIDNEISLEANPDDLDEAYLTGLKEIGINRLSIGIQSFHDPHLTYMNRAHNSELAKGAVPLARKVGFANISIDLIYALPANDHSIWKDDLHTAISLAPDHISSYCLTIEPKTVFGNWRNQGKLWVMSDDFAAEQYEILIDALSLAGYNQYEISNFCLKGNESRHNSNYWRQQPYLGVGPGAHSFNGSTRQFNLAHNVKYIEAISQEEIPAEIEILSEKDRINEWLLTGLRTAWGCDLDHLKMNYNYDIWSKQGTTLKTMKDQGLIQATAHLIKLTQRGKLLADQICADLFIN